MAIPINIEDLLNKQKIESNEGCGDTVILNVPHDVPQDVPHDVPHGVTHELGSKLGSRLGSAVIGKLNQAIKPSDNGGTP